MKANRASFKEETLLTDRSISNSVITEDAVTQMSFLQKVYSLFLAGLGSASLAGFLVLTNDNLAKIILVHPILTMLAYFVVYFIAMGVRKTPGINVLALLAFTFVSGAFISAALWMMRAQTGSLEVVYQALALTGSIFLGLTVYTFVSKKDFSFLGQTVTVGMIAVFFILILNGLFFHSSAANMAVSWIGAVLFSLVILFFTSQIMRTHESDEYISAALSLYLAFVNLFLFILQILMGQRRD